MKIPARGKNWWSVLCLLDSYPKRKNNCDWDFYEMKTWAVKLGEWWFENKVLPKLIPLFGIFKLPIFRKKEHFWWLLSQNALHQEIVADWDLDCNSVNPIVMEKTELEYQERSLLMDFWQCCSIIIPIKGINPFLYLMHDLVQA